MFFSTEKLTETPKTPFSLGVAEEFLITYDSTLYFTREKI